MLDLATLPLAPRELLNFRNQPQTATLVCTEVFWNELRGHLLKPDGKERVVFSLLGRSEGSGRVVYYGYRLLTIPDERCVEQHPYLVEPDPAVVVDCFDAYKQSCTVAFMHAHSHPFCNVASFSGIDNAYLPGTVQSLHEYLKAVESCRPCRFLRMVTGQHEGGFKIEVYDSQMRFVEDINEVRLISRKGLRKIMRQDLGSPTAANVVGFSEQDRARLDRNVRWLGEEGQTAIVNTHVAVVGVGGVGTELVKICRGLGIKNYTLIDMDTVETSNLNRLIWSSADVGEYKVKVAKKFILSVIPDAQVSALTAPVESPGAQDALSEVDVILAAVDNDSARLNLQVLAARTLKPLLDLGSGIQLDGNSSKVKSMGAQVALYVPGGPCLACQGLDLKSVVDPDQRKARRRIGYIEGTDT
jgi:molybdopterin/thiamine biosynthesis adenylyltransferase